MSDNYDDRRVKIYFRDEIRVLYNLDIFNWVTMIQYAVPS